MIPSKRLSKAQAELSLYDKIDYRQKKALPWFVLAADILARFGRAKQ
jgi:hypothetical protein